MQPKPSIVARPRPGRTFVLGALLTTLAPAAAAAGLEGAPDPVLEAGCDVAVTLDGPIARVVETHRVVTEPAAAAARADRDRGRASTQALYRFELAAGGLIDGYQVAPAGGRVEDGLVVPAESIDRDTPAMLGLPPDLGLLRVVARDGDRTSYEARMYPVVPGKAASFTIRWSAPLTYTGGRLTLRIPARGERASDGNLSRCAVKVAAGPGGGVRSWAAVYAAGTSIGTGAHVRGAASVSALDPLVIEATPHWASADPVLATVRTGDALAIGVFVPDQVAEPKLAPPRLLLVVDTSRSMGTAGRAAAVAIVDGLLRAVPASTKVELVLFDRTPRRVLGTWATDTTDRRAYLTAAVAGATAASGSDVARALRLAADAVGDEPARVVLVTDALLPTALDAAALKGHFPASAEHVVVDAVVPVIPGAALPERGPLHALTEAYHGRVATVRTQDVPGSAGLVRLLVAGLPIDAPVIDGGSEGLDVDLPTRMEPGEGVWLLAVDHGGAPLRLRAGRAGKELAIKPTALPAAAGRFAVAEAMRRLDLEDAATFALARDHRLVTTATAIVVPDLRGPAGRERAAVARRTGMYSRTAPPGDPAAGPVEAAPRVESPSVVVVGELPRQTVELVVRDQLMPHLEVCYRAHLRRAPTAAGALVVELEIARGEVMDVHLTGDHFPASMIDCVADVAFGVTTPAYALGEQPDTVYVVRKPVTFRPPETVAGVGTLEEGEASGRAVNPGQAVDVNSDDPL